MDERKEVDKHGNKIPLDIHDQEPVDRGHGGEKPEHGGDIALSQIMMIGLAGTAILIVLIILLRGLFINALERERFDKVISQKPAQLQQFNEQAQNRINSYGWLDREAGVVSIPLEQAMALAADELRMKQAAPPETTMPLVEDTDIEAGDETAVAELAEEAAENVEGETMDSGPDSLGDLPAGEDTGHND